MDNFGASLIEQSAIVKDQLYVSPEGLLVWVPMLAHLLHDSADVHRLRHNAAVLLIYLIVADRFWRHWIQEIGRLIVIVELAQDVPALLHVRVAVLLLSEWVILL